MSRGNRVILTKFQQCVLFAVVLCLLAIFLIPNELYIPWTSRITMQRDLQSISKTVNDKEDNIITREIMEKMSKRKNDQMTMLRNLNIPNNEKKIEPINAKRVHKTFLTSKKDELIINESTKPSQNKNEQQKKQNDSITIQENKVLINNQINNNQDIDIQKAEIIIPTTTKAKLDGIHLNNENENKTKEIMEIDGNLNKNSKYNGYHSKKDIIDQKEEDYRIRMDLMRDIPIPNLVLLGPPKCGTRSFVDLLSSYIDVVQFGPERSFWGGNSRWKCIPNWNKTVWTNYLNNYLLNKTNLSWIAYNLHKTKGNRGCYVERYEKLWIIKQDDPIYPELKDVCVHPFVYRQLIQTKYRKYGYIDNNMSSIPPCYLIEKSPAYSREPWVHILYSWLAPNIKILTIIRSPIHHVLTTIFSFHRIITQSGNMTKTKLNILDEFKTYEPFNNFTDLCRVSNIEYNKLINFGNKERYLLMRKFYKKFVYEYFWWRFISSKDINKSPRKKMEIWTTFIYPGFIIGLLSYDETMDIYNNIDWNPLDINYEIKSYRFIQFEWLYEDIGRSMRTLKCWMMNIYDEYECNQKVTDKENEEIFGKPFVKKNHNNLTIHVPDKWFEDEIMEIFEPCITSFKNIALNDRPHLLLGDWNTWNYTYVE